MSSNFFFTTHIQISDIITIQETKLTPKAKTPKLHNFTTVRTDRLHKSGCVLITVVRDNITLTTTDIRSNINTHNTELQIVMVHLTTTNTSLLQTCIYLLETAHPRIIKQSTQPYNTAYSTSQTYHTQSSPEWYLWGMGQMIGPRSGRVWWCYVCVSCESVFCM